MIRHDFREQILKIFWCIYVKQISQKILKHKSIFLELLFIQTILTDKFKRFRDSNLNIIKDTISSSRVSYQSYETNKILDYITLDLLLFPFCRRILKAKSPNSWIRNAVGEFQLQQNFVWRTPPVKILGISITKTA